MGPTKGIKLVSCVLKIIVIVSAVVGIYMSAFDTSYAFMGGKRVFMFFTIQSNIALALISLIGLFLLAGSKMVKNYWFVIKFVGAVSITLTGVVFSFVLVPTIGPAAWDLRNTLTHVVVPVCSVIDYLLIGVYGDVTYRDVGFVTIPPLLYAAYAGIGYAAGWQFGEGIRYPYFFLNWGSPAGAFGFTDSLPYMGCVWWILALLAFLILVGFLYVWLVNVLKKHMLKPST